MKEMTFNSAMIEAIIDGKKTCFRIVSDGSDCPYKTGDLVLMKGAWENDDEVQTYLHVTDVHKEKLNDIDEFGERSAYAEGFVNDVNYRMQTGTSARMHFAEAWDTQYKDEGLKKFGWSANPNVWCILFEAVDKEDAQDLMKTETNQETPKKRGKAKAKKEPKTELEVDASVGATSKLN